jgi:hypothetical protein
MATMDSRDAVPDSLRLPLRFDARRLREDLPSGLAARTREAPARRPQFRSGASSFLSLSTAFVFLGVSSRERR